MSSSTEKLIELIKKYPILYDLGHQDYKNVRKRDKIWDQIGSELKKRWKNLRDSYVKYLKSVKTKTGQAAKKNYTKWQWAGIKEAFKPYMAFAKTDSNVSQLQENDEYQTENLSHNESAQLSDNVVDSDIENTFRQFTSISSNVNEVSTESQTPVNITEPQVQPTTSTVASYVSEDNHGSKRHVTAVSKPISAVDSVLDYFRNKKQKPDYTPIEMIFLGYAHTMQTFSPRLQAITKGKIAQIIMEQELLNQELSVTPNHLHSRPPSSTSSHISVPMTSPAFSVNSRPSSSTNSYVHIPMNSPLENIDFQQPFIHSGSSEVYDTTAMSQYNTNDNITTPASFLNDFTP